MKFYDLFAGIGGFRLGLERSGFQCVGSCEIDRYAREIYRKNFGDYPTESDIRAVDASKLPDFDILTAGFPCQAFSYAGKRMGFNDTRGTLFLEIARIAAAKRPKILFLENVKGLLNHDRGRTFGTIISTLYELGYDTIEWQVINGKYFVPQNRERVFIIGYSREKPTRKIFPIQDISKNINRTQEETQSASHTKGNIKQRIHDRSETWTMDTSSSKQLLIDDSTFLLTPNNFQHKAGDGTKTRKRNISHIHPALQARSGHSQATYLSSNSRIRKLTPLECERLMGFPDGWTEGQSDTQRYKTLGNAVIPQIIEMIASKLPLIKK